MDDDTKNLWDVRLGFVVPIVTLLGIFIGLFTFYQEQEENIRLEMKLLACKDEIEFERRLWLAKLEVYAELLDVVGEIATTPDNSTDLSEDLRKRFLSKYWGNALLVEDERAESAMRRFRVELDHFRDGWSTNEELKKRAYELGNILKATLDWKNQSRNAASECF